MKKTLVTFIITALFLVTFVTNVQALSFGVKITPTSTEVKKGGTVTLTLSVSNLDVGSNGINAFIATIDYDKTVFETLTALDITSENAWDTPTFNPNNGKVILTKGSFVNSESKVFSVKLTAKSAAPIGETKVTFKDIEASNSKEDINATDTTYVLKVVENNSDNGNNGETTVKPSVNVKYEAVANGVKVTLESDSELQALAGWTLSSDKKSLTKVYTEAFKGSVTVKNTAGISSDAINIDVKVGSSSDNNNNNNNNNGNKDTTKPTASIKYTKNTNGVTVTITASEEIKPVTGWTLSSDKKTLTRLFKENYTGTLTIEDLAGNKSDALSIKVDTSLPNGGTDTTNNNNGSNGNNSPSSLPKAGAAYIVPAIAIIAVVGTVAFIRFKSMEY